LGDDVKELVKESQAKYKTITPESPLAGEDAKISRLGKRWVALGTDYFPYEFNVVKPLLFQMGYKAGKKICSRYKEKGMDPKKAVEFSLAGASFFGWGEARLIDEKEGTSVVKIYSAFEAESFIANEKNPSSQGECNFLRGVLGGIWSIYTGKECQVKEINCMAKGNEVCEFHITSEKE
jgi:predicted hydrocarbon binding protein